MDKSETATEPTLIDIGGTAFDITSYGVLDFSLDDPSDDQADFTDVENEPNGA